MTSLKEGLIVGKSRGKQLVFDPMKLSALDITALIDYGKRFNLITGLEEIEYDSIDEIYKEIEDANSRSTIRKRTGRRI